jgi:hypothetical protein
MAPETNATARAVSEAHAALRQVRTERERVAAALASAADAAAPHADAEQRLAQLRARLEDALAAEAVGQLDAATVARQRADVDAAERALAQVTGLRDSANATAAGLQRLLDASDAGSAAAEAAVHAATVAHLNELWREADAELLDLGLRFAKATARIFAVKRELRAPGHIGPRDLPELLASGPVTEAEAHRLDPRAPHGWGRSFIPVNIEPEAHATLARELAELTAPTPNLLDGVRAVVAAK